MFISLTDSEVSFIQIVYNMYIFLYKELKKALIGE